MKDILIMTAADELREAISANREKMGAAMASAGSKWEMRTEEEWGARKIAEHCIGSDYFFAGMMAEAMKAEKPAGGDPTIESAGEAASAAAKAAEVADGVFATVTDSDLATFIELPEGVPFAKNIEGVLGIVAGHHEVHAEQIHNA